MSLPIVGGGEIGLQLDELSMFIYPCEYIKKYILVYAFFGTRDVNFFIKDLFEMNQRPRVDLTPSC